MIMDYNRVVKDLNGLSKDEFFDKLKEKFDLVKENEAVTNVIKSAASILQSLGISFPLI